MESENHAMAMLGDGGLTPEQVELGQTVLAFFDEDQLGSSLSMFGGRAAFASGAGVAQFEAMITKVVGTTPTEQCHSMPQKTQHCLCRGAPHAYAKHSCCN